MTPTPIKIKHVFSSEEIAALQRQLYEHIDRKQAVREELKAISKARNEIIRAHELQVTKLLVKIRDGYEEIEVLCDVKVDPERNTVYFTRQDTGALVHHISPIPDEYRQMEVGV